MPTTPTASPDLQPPESPQHQEEILPTTELANDEDEPVPEERSPSEPDEVDAPASPVPEDTTSQEQDEKTEEASHGDEDADEDEAVNGGGPGEVN